jgi:hypothetical protein
LFRRFIAGVRSFFNAYYEPTSGYSFAYEEDGYELVTAYLASLVEHGLIHDAAVEVIEETEELVVPDELRHVYRDILVQPDLREVSDMARGWCLWHAPRVRYSQFYGFEHGLIDVNVFNAWELRISGRDSRMAIALGLADELGMTFTQWE